MSRLRFRNVEAEPGNLVESWPLEALQTALERGDIRDYRRIVASIDADPWGPTARRVEQVLTWCEPYGAANLMRRAVHNARVRWVAREREWVRDELGACLVRSGLTRGEFASRLGTSASRLSTYLSGSVAPSATLIARARARAVADRGSRQTHIQ